MKVLLRIKHFFTGHGLLIDFDEQYLYCECGYKRRHYQNKFAKYSNGKENPKKLAEIRKTVKCGIPAFDKDIKN